MLPQQITTLIHQFTKLPGIGPRQAARFAFYLLRNAGEIDVLEKVLKNVRENIKLCKACFLPTVYECAQCGICANPQRDKNVICVVEKENDALNMEKTSHFRGRYFVLGGFINPLEKESLAHTRLAMLISQLISQTKLDLPFYHDRGKTVNLQTTGADHGCLEIILALTPRREGDFTSLYIEEQLKPLRDQGRNIKITRLGRGLSSGAELEYADGETLKNALEGRR